MFLDELQLSTELSAASENAAVDPSSKVSKAAMIFGILTKRILPGATVLGFSRSGDFINKEFLDKRSEVYSIQDLTDEDIEELIQKHIKDPERINLKCLIGTAKFFL